MGGLRLKCIPSLFMMTSLAAAAPAWAQTAERVRSDDAVLKRIDALTREVQQLKAQVRANKEKTNKAAEEAKEAKVTATKSASTMPVKAGEGIMDEFKKRKASVEFYGMIDMGAEDLVGTLANGNDANSIRFSNGMITPHAGIRGRGQLVDGVQGLFNLEGSFAPDNGTSGIGGRLWGRQAWVGVGGKYGTVTLGRQYTMLRMGWEDSNPYGTGNQGLRLLDPRISNPRADNSISYRVNWGDFTFGANYSSGWDAVNNNPSGYGTSTSAGANCVGEVPDSNPNCREWSVGAKYKGVWSGGTWGLAASYEELSGGVSATTNTAKTLTTQTSGTYGGLTNPDLKDKRSVLSGYWKFKGGPTVTAGWINRDNDGGPLLASPVTARSNMYWLQSIVPIYGPWYVDGVLAHLKYDNSADKATLLNLRARYVLSEDTTVYVTTAYMMNGGNSKLAATASTPLPTPTAGGNQASIIAGLLYKFSVGAGEKSGGDSD